MLVTRIFSSPEHKVLRVGYCDHSPSIVRSHCLVYTLVSTNTKQSAPNLVKICMTIRSRMSLIMDLIRPEYLELFGLDLKKLLYFVYTLASININQSPPNLIKIYLTIRSLMSSILDQIGPERPELFALELKKLLYFTVYTLASTNINQSIPNMVKIYMIIRS